MDTVKSSIVPQTNTPTIESYFHQYVTGLGFKKSKDCDLYEIKNKQGDELTVALSFDTFYSWRTIEDACVKICDGIKILEPNEIPFFFNRLVRHEMFLNVVRKGF